jgi:hypothetical protein
MSYPARKILIDPDELFACRDIRLQDRRETQYPQLMRLCVDFNFSVLQLQRKIFSHLTRKMVPSALEFVLAIRDENSSYWYSMTPSLANLKSLNEYAKQYEVDILHAHLFGDEDPELNQFQERGFYS